MMKIPRIPKSLGFEQSRVLQNGISNQTLSPVAQKYEMLREKMERL